MAEVEKSVEAWVRDRKVTLTPAKRNRLVNTFYNHFRSQQPPSH